ncbi:MAG: TIM barrel protein [Christensenellales bacterium]
MMLACVSEMVPGSTLTDKANRLRRWGYGGITVFADRATWNEEKLEELIHLEVNTGVVPCEFLFMSPDAGKLMSDDVAQSEATLVLYTEAAEVCARIGAVTEIEYVLGPQDPLPLFDIYKQMDDRQEARFLELYRSIAKPVAGTKASVLLEGINRYESPYMNSILDCKRVAEKTGLAQSGVLADFFHMSIEESDTPKAIRTAGDCIGHVHLGDNNRRLPGYGDIDWENGLKALKEIGYDGFLTMECSTMGKPETALPEAAEYINGILARI